MHLGILGSSVSHIKQALVPADADKEPIQDNSDANIFIPPFFFYFAILTVRNIVIFIVIIW